MYSVFSEKNIRRLPAFWGFVFYLAGIVLGRYFLLSLPVLTIGILLFTSIMSAVFVKKYKSLFILFAFLLSGTLSIYSQLAAFPKNHLIFLNTQKVQSVNGWIESAQYRQNNKNRYIIHCTSVRINGKELPVKGKIYVYQGKYENRLSYGDCLTLTSRLNRPPLPENPGAFNFRAYLDVNGISFQTSLDEGRVKRLPGYAGSPVQRLVLEPLRKYIRHIIFRYIPQPTAGVILALLLGERQNLDHNIQLLFQKTGIVHVLAISGLHIGFILMFFLLVLGFLPIPYGKRIGWALFFLFFFIALTGFKASAVRAGLMAGFYFVSRFLERRVPPLNILAVAGLVIILPFPNQALTPGFQFSFAAVGGILFGYPHLKQAALFKRGSHRVQRFLVQPFLVSLCAVLATTPLTWWYYGSVQTGAVLINIVLIPFIGGLVALSFLFILLPAGLSFLLTGLGQLIHIYFTGISTVNAWFADQPFVQIQMGKPELWLLIGIILLVLLLLRATKQSISIAVLLSLFLFFSYSTAPSHLQVTFVNVRQGDGAIIRLPNGKTVVIDGGDRNKFMDAGARYMVPLLRHYGVHHIAYLVGTHPHSDHIGGLLAIMESFPVDTLVLSRYANKTELYRQLLRTAYTHHIPIAYKQRGDQLFLGPEFRAYVLHPFGKYVYPQTYSGNEVNISSLVIQIRYGRTSFLFTGDLERNAEPELSSYKQFIRSDVLKVGHHGSKTSSSLAFLTQVRPHYSVISVGRRNKFFHPSKTTVARLRRLGARPLRTDHFGALVFLSDGQTIRPVFWR